MHKDSQSNECLSPESGRQVSLNEEVDPTLIIRRLKAELRDVKEEVRLLKGEGEDRGPLTPDELQRLRGQVRES